MGSALKVRLVIGKPADHWLSEEPVKDGYWGFVSICGDYTSDPDSFSSPLDGTNVEP